MKKLYISPEMELINFSVEGSIANYLGMSDTPTDTYDSNKKDFYDGNAHDQSSIWSDMMEEE